MEDYKNGLWYEFQSDYYLPCLKLPEERTAHIGIWGQRHLRYLKQYHKVSYYNLLTSGKLNNYLADLNEQAENMFSRLVKQLAERESVTEALKAENQMLPDDSKSPQTGDNSNLLLWIALLFISGGAVTATTVYGRKKKRSVK